MSKFTTPTGASVKEVPVNEAPANKADATQAVSMPEYLSAMLDDEGGAFEQRRVLDELKTENKVDGNLHKKLSSYALIGETLRSGKPAISAGSGFLSGIQDQLVSEPEYSTPVLEEQSKSDIQKTNNSWLRPVGGFAMAASLAAIAVIGFQNYFGQADKGFTGSTEVVAIQNAPAGKGRLTQAEMDNAIVVSADSLQADALAKAKIDSASNSLVNGKTNASASNSATLNSTTEYRQADVRTRTLLKQYVDSHMQYASTTAFVPSIRVIAYSDY